MTPAASAPPQTRRSLGLWTSTSLVVGNMVGSGVFLLPASLAAYGGVSILGWLFTTAGAMLLALVFAWLSRLVPRTGGPYAFARAGLGKLPGFLVAWGYWISFFPGNAAIAVAGVGYLGFFVPALAAKPLLAALVTVVVIWLVAWVNARGVREAGGLQLVTTVLKLLPLVAIGAYGLTTLQVSHFVPFNSSGGSLFSAVSGTAALTLWAFIGFESATIPAADVTDPERTIPRATILGTMVAAVIYIAGTVGVMGVIDPAVLRTSSAPFADAAAALWGRWAASLVAAGAVVSCFGALNGWTLLLAQLPRAAAEDGLLPAVFARLSRRGTPAAGLVISNVLVTLLVVTNYARGLVGAFTFLILLATLATLLPYAASALAFLRLEARAGPAAGAPSPAVGGPRPAAGGRRSAVRRGVALLGLAYALWAIVSTGVEALAWGAVLLVAGVPVYLWMVRGRGRLKAPPPHVDSGG